MSIKRYGVEGGTGTGGQHLPMILTLGSTVGTMVGTGSSVGAVGFGYTNGWAGMLYGLGGAVGLLLVAWLFAPVRKFRFMTMSEEMSYYTGGSKIIKNLVAILRAYPNRILFQTMKPQERCSIAS